MKTDSVTVAKNLNLQRIGLRTKRAAAMLIERRLWTLREFIKEFDLQVRISIVPSEINRAYITMRVRYTCRKMHDEPVNIIAAVYCPGNEELNKLYDIHYFAMDRNLFLARKVDTHVIRDAEKFVVERCERCKSIDSAPSRHESNNIHVEENAVG